MQAWNDLPESVVTAPSLHAFEKKIRQTLGKPASVLHYDAKLERPGSGTFHLASDDDDEDLDIEAT